MAGTATGVSNYRPAHRSNFKQLDLAAESAQAGLLLSDEAVLQGSFAFHSRSDATARGAASLTLSTPLFVLAAWVW